MLRQQCSWCLRQHARFMSYALEEDLPRITIPHRMMINIDKKKQKNAEKQQVEKRSGPIVIRCKRPQFNHHLSQKYTEFKPATLASHGWKNRKSHGDYFVINAFRGNPALDVADGITHFHHLGLSEEIVSAAEKLGISKPTNIQAKTIPSMLQGKNLLCAAETGSGKTLAYMLPMFEKILQFNKRYGPVEEGNLPHGVVLLPSRELADQVFAVTSEFAEPLGMRIHSVCGGRGTQIILRTRPEAPVDILISTPGVLSKLLTNRIYWTDNLKSIVLDEADSLLDDSFSPLTLRLLQKLKVTSESCTEGDGREILGSQLSLVGATIPLSLRDLMENIVPIETVERVITTHTHRLMPHVPQKFYRLGPTTKHQHLLMFLMELKQKKEPQPTIVFCNKTSTSHFVANMLNDNEIKHVHLHGDMRQLEREGLFQKFQDEQYNVLVATDIASRGLDTCHVKHVVNYEFPSFISDYIHRVGRVGRVGSDGTGVVHNYISRRYEVDLVWTVETAARKISALHNVNANIKRKLNALKENKELGETVAKEMEGGAEYPM